MSLFKRKSDIPNRRSLQERTLHQVDNGAEVFKRNRTLTGTTSNRFDATNTRSDLESTRAQVHHLVNRRRGIFSVFVIVFIVSVFIWLVVSNLTAIARISLSGTLVSKPVESSVYARTIQEYLGINPMGRFRFLLDESSLSKYVSDKLPEVESVTQLNTIGVGVTTFSVKMRQPVAGWEIDDKQYYVDSMGIPFEKNYFSTPSVQIIDNSGISMQSGTVIASNKFLSFVGRVVNLSESSGFKVKKAIIPVNTIRILEVYLDGYNYPIKLSIDRPAGEQVEDMVRTVGYFVNNGITPSYVDIRVGGKAFYK